MGDALKPHPAFEHLRRELAGYPEVSTVQTVRTGAVRIETNLVTPSGSHVVVFLRPAIAGTDPCYVVTDYGHLIQEKRDNGAKIEHQQAAIDALLRRGSASRSGEELFAVAESLNALPKAVLRLARACLAVAELAGRTPRRAPEGDALVRDLMKRWAGALELMGPE